MAVRFAWLSFAVSTIVLVLKVGAWRASGSTALLGDAAESALDGVTALLLVLSVRFAARPPDAGHPWGHGKVEYFSSGFQGALILAAALGVCVEAVRSSFGTPEPLELGVGLALSSVATALNLGLALTLIRVGRAERSPALEADGHHNLADVYTTLGAWAGLGLAWATGLWFLDPLVALLVAVHILWTGVTLMRTAVDGLMDATVPAEDMARLQSALDAVLAVHPGSGIDRLRARESSQRVFVDCVLLVPGDRTVASAHDICDALEQAAETALPGAEVQVHVEPAPRG